MFNETHTFIFTFSSAVETKLTKLIMTVETKLTKLIMTVEIKLTKLIMTIR